jgi:Predicted Zn-dependent protease (DUF2268)
MNRLGTGVSVGIATLAAVCICACAQDSGARASANRDPQTALISTADIDLFWQAYDEWKSSAQSAPDQLAGILDRDYIQKGSQAVKDFIPHRIISADALATRILGDQKYYEDVRAATLKMSSYVPEIRKGFVQLKEMYPDTTFPPVYFVIGRRSSGGTDTRNGLIIGAEMFADDNRSRIHLTDVVSIVIHELIHYQQQTQGDDLTTEVMKEGAADFISERITGHDIDEDTKPYGDSNEEELWNKFQEDRKTNDLKPWLYNSGNPNRVGPPDLGYYMGYKICQSFYEIAADKGAALKTIIAMKDPRRFIEQSGYARRFN